ncbi:MAG: response regulator [Candidatus Rokubacteria bacterium]|nr:response regulator [Candidatus Rokubacteria bacterium]
MQQSFAIDRHSVTVLNVDDESESRRTTTQVLARAGYRVVEAARGLEALGLVRDRAPEFMLLDVDLPDMSGLDVCRQVKSSPATDATIVVYLTTASSAAATVRGLESGADGYVTAPVDEGVLVATIDALVRARRAEEAARRQAQRSKLMAEASRRLGASLDYEATLARLPELLVPALADGCAIDVVESDGRVRRLAAASLDAERRQVATALRRKYRVPRDAPYGIGKVIRTGEPDFYPEITDAHFVAAAQDAEHLALLRRMQLSAAIVVPLRARDAVLGTLSLIRAGSGGRYDEEDLVFAEDLASRAAVAVDNARLYRAAQQAERRKDEFLAMLAHELRNPLASVVNALSVLERTSPQEGAVVRMRDIIKRQSLHLARLVDDLLDVSRVQLGKITLERTDVDLNETVRRSFESLHASGKTSNHDVAIALAREPVVVAGDAVRLEQIVGNLLDNAVKYSPAGAPIRVSVDRDRAEAVVRVHDQGIGISAEDLGRIFDLFSQAERTLDRARGGLGLGLALARALVELHGGRIAASSPGLGRGSEFVVRLPLQVAGAGSRDVFEPVPTGVRRRVLVVEDNDDAREALRAVLEIDGHEVAVAADGAAGVAAALSFQPDVALIDIGLPGLDGYEVCRRLRATPAGASICVIALTGYGQPEDHAATAEAGFDAHLVKPVEPAVLERAIGALLSGNMAP